jgi:hypothetical protein
MPSSHTQQHYILASVQLLWPMLEMLHRISCYDMSSIQVDVVTVHAIKACVEVEKYIHLFYSRE